MARRILIASIVLLALATGSAVRADGVRPAPAAAEATITAGSSRDLVEELASDAMAGRATPSPGLDSAAAFIVRQFERAGLEPVEGSWYHGFDLSREDLDSGNAVAIDQRRFELKADFIPFDFSRSGVAQGSVVFAGYGIAMPDSGYNDYDGIDVRGRVVLVVAGEPKRFQAAGFSLRTSWFATSRQKMLTAARLGAVGILIVPNPTVSRLMRPGGFPWPALYPSMPREGRLKLRLDDSIQSIPAVSVGASVARALLGPVENLVGVLDAIDSTGRPRSRELGRHALVDVRIARTLVPARNVMGMLRGRELPEEYVVLGAHYDHVGTRSSEEALTHAGGAPEDTIFNGADDNASGTSAVILAARAFASLAPEDQPSRSILFVAFTAEELGLFGSRAFVANPPVETRQMVAMLNMDMVGRNAIDTISVGGLSRSPDLAAILAAANEPEPFVLLDDIEQDFYRSDQAPFARAGIPVLFFHSGEHSDYHKVGDNPDRLDNAKVAKVARLAFRTAWMVSESPGRPGFTGVDPNDPKAAFIFER
ncbi:MAG TPA: M28 family peptidase [Candidatus Kapabacteria bacterium]|nr:M28 family peptidase [Candidatus Kapabacteria bacterium]